LKICATKPHPRQMAHPEGYMIYPFTKFVF
jgi:hypothetical protein